MLKVAWHLPELSCLEGKSGQYMNKYQLTQLAGRKMPQF